MRFLLCLPILCLPVLLGACGGKKTIPPTSSVLPQAVDTRQHALSPVAQKPAPASFIRASPKPVPTTSNPSFTPEMVRGRIDILLQTAHRFDELSFLPDPLPFSNRQLEKIGTCRSELTRLSEGYAGLLRQLAQTPFTEKERGIVDGVWQSLYRDESFFFQGECPGILFMAAPRNSSWLQVFTPEKRTETTAGPSPLFGQDAFAQLRLLHEQKRFQEVAVFFDTLSNIQIATLPLDAFHLVGSAMIKTGRIDSAATCYQIMADESESPVAAISPLLKAADLFFAAGDTKRAGRLYATAVTHYRDLAAISFWPETQLQLLQNETADTPDIALYRQLLADFQSNELRENRSRIVAQADALIGKYPESLGAQGARSLKKMVAASVQTWFNKKIDQIIQHVSHGDFARVTPLFETIARADLPDELRLLLAAKKNEVALLQEGHGRALFQQEQETLANKWQEAMTAYDANKFDAAIGLFASLLQTSFDAQAREQIAAAARKAAEIKRKKAATLYVKAREAAEPTKKAALCRESKALLLEILARYPETKISQKVKGNLAVVEECIRANEPVTSILPGS